MAHTYICSLFHVVFSTKDRRPMITSDLQPRLFPYMGGIARTNGFTALAIGGVEDHVHLLLSLPATLAPAKAVQLIKGGSSKWVHKELRERWEFEWQEGYGAFSIGQSQVARTEAYIARQFQHHQRKTFQKEFIGFLESHGISYDPQYIWR